MLIKRSTKKGAGIVVQYVTLLPGTQHPISMLPGMVWLPLQIQLPANAHPWEAAEAGPQPSLETWVVSGTSLAS